MQRNTISLSDILLLCKLFAGTDAQPCIFDPKGRMIADASLQEGACETSRILVNLADELIEFKGHPLDDFEFILDFGRAQAPALTHSKTLRYVNHPKGHMRWLFQGNDLSSVLPFYNASGLRGKAIGWGISIVSKLGLGGRFAAGQFTLRSTKAFHLDQRVKDDETKYSVFMGTPGLQRSLLVALGGRGVAPHFLKVAVSSEAKNLLSREASMLHSMGERQWNYMTLPKVASASKEALLLTSVKTKSSTRTSAFTTTHAQAVAELFNSNTRVENLWDSAHWEATKNNTWRAQLSKHEAIRGLGAQLSDVAEQMDASQQIVNQTAHGDFTPWNMYVDQGRLALYDWELSRSSAPALFDLFHFHYQRGILMQRIDHMQIRDEIEDALQQPEIKNLVEMHRLDVATYHRLYLLTAVSYFINVYAQQELTLQNQWQLTTWKSALKECLAEGQKVENCRPQFMQAFNSMLRDVPHAFLKFDAASLAQLPESSDLDIAIAKDRVDEVIEFAQNHPLVDRISIHQKSFMAVLEIHFRDGSFLSVDLIHRFQRKELAMLEMEEVLAASSLGKKGVVQPALKHDLAYAFAFYTLNGSSIPLRYFSHYSAESQGEMNEAIKYVNGKFGTSFQRIGEVFTNGIAQHKRVQKHLRKTQRSSRLFGTITYIADSLRDLFHRQGFIITFSGVDGVGKSTVIQEVRKNIEQRYRKEVVMLRHRPGVLPILSSVRHGQKRAEAIAGETIPRKGKNRSTFSSALRFGYYYSDYLLGQLYVWVRYILRGKIVLYDRYYFDFINDSRRSNIDLDPRITRWLYRFVMKPRLNIFLYAQAAVIRKRKQELSTSDIISLSGNYKALFDSLAQRQKKSIYKSIENDELQKTIAAVMQEFQRVA